MADCDSLGCANRSLDAVEIEVCVDVVDRFAGLDECGELLKYGLAECTRRTREPAQSVISCRAHVRGFDR